MEIREDYVEESSLEGESEPGPLEQVSSSFSEAAKEKVSIDDEDFARLMSRLDVLEKEEREAEADNESDEDEQTKADLAGLPDQISLPEMEHIEKPESRKPLEWTKDKDAVAEGIINNQHRPDFPDELNCTGLTANSVPRDEPPSYSNTSANNLKKSVEKTVAPAVLENKVQAFASTSQVAETPLQNSRLGFDSQKAFTGSIIEHADNIETSSRKHTPSKNSSSQPSKPGSRFKMQRK